MHELASVLLEITARTTVPEVSASTMQALARLLDPAWICILLWDEELGRHTVGGTWLNDAHEADAGQIRRLALKYAQGSYARDESGLCEVEDRVLRQALATADCHVGLCFVGAPHVPDATAEAVELVLKAAAQAISHAAALEQAQAEHTQLVAERERLERLLRAVQDQQQVIDRLLASEREWSASLEAKVQERTAALRAAQNHLIQSEKLAVIGQLASSLAHEINNPLQAIQSGLGLIGIELAQSNTDQVIRDIDMIQAELGRIQALFRQLLDFYRPVETQWLPLDLADICHAVGALTRKRLEEAGLTFEIEVDACLPQTCGDSNQIKQVLLNLLLNAAEALEGRGGYVTLRSQVEAEDVVLQVIDDGPGIEPDHLASVFKPLFTTKTRGLGLGLAISQEIVQRHGGTMTVTSMPGTGSQFTVRLPVRGRCDDA